MFGIIVQSKVRETGLIIVLNRIKELKKKNSFNYFSQT